MSAALGLLAGAAAVALSWAHIHDTPLLLAHPWPGTWAVAGVVVALALVNATGEELLWRAVLWPDPGGGIRLGHLLGVQALSFGVAHAGGLPAASWGCSRRASTGLSSLS